MGFLHHLNPTQQFIFFSFVKIVLVIGPLLGMVAYIVLVERKVSAFIQDRLGPNRVGLPLFGIGRLIGLGQPIADGIKGLLKEDFTPEHVRKIYFWLAPPIPGIPALLTGPVIPFCSNLVHQNIVFANPNPG